MYGERQSKPYHYHEIESYAFAIKRTAVHRDPVLHFPDHEFWNVKTMRASEKCSGMIIIEVEICHRMEPMRIYYCITLNEIVKVKLSKWLFDE